jgi:transposase
MQHTILNFINQHFFIGIDVHLKQWKVTIRNTGIELKTFSMNPSPQELFHYLQKHYPGGTYHLVYEAGFCGFWIQRTFTELGIHCIIVHPADTPTTAKEKVHKTDPVDSRKLARELENGSLKAIYVPQVASEQLRSLMRLRFRLVQQQTRTKNRIKGFLRVNGIAIPAVHLTNPRWSGAFLLWLKGVHPSSVAGGFTLDNLILQLEQTRLNLSGVLRQLRREATSKNLASTVEAIDSAPGIAFITTMTLITEIIDASPALSISAVSSGSYLRSIPPARLPIPEACPSGTTNICAPCSLKLPGRLSGKILLSPCALTNSVERCQNKWLLSVLPKNS